ncbi:MAG: substrate-binding domain-containing protein [Armatimonadota bacterium]|nr:substrate-binding domain-containing protein [Armatimonadota bacterium]
MQHQIRRAFAEKMNYQGGYCLVRHMPGSSCFTSRTFAAVTELKKIAPKMKLLDMQATGLKAEKTMQVVSDWITRFGPELKGIISSDDSGAQIGINEACGKAHREDIIRVAAGHSKVGLDFVKGREVYAITYQSAESDGALPMKLAADWFNGKPVTRPVYYLPRRLITKNNVKDYYPAQW